MKYVILTNMTLSDDLSWRGLLKDKTFSETTWLDEPKAFYMGIDASADSLTVGNLAFVMLGRRLASAGWKTVLLMGGGTSLVGDPGGKTEERQLMSREDVQKNIAGVRAQVEKLFSGEQFEMVDNYDWLAELKYVDFLREVGKHFSMTELMQREFVRERMNEGASGISYAEFSYSLVQGYDFWHLFKNMGVMMQIGGSDQWGNMLSGVALIRKKESQEAHALSMPLIINKATGVKFGKSEEGAVWLDENRTSVYKFYQFWLNLDDEGVEDYIKIYTMLSKEEIERVIAEFQQNPGGRLAQKTLAYEATKLVHGQERADNVKKASEVLFGEGKFLDLNEVEVTMLKAELPHTVAAEDIFQVLVDTGLASSKSEARNFVTSGAIMLNDQKLSDDQPVQYRQGANLLKRGKNNFAIVEAG